MKKIDEIYISNHEKFLMVDNRHYGGNQGWLYTNKLRRKFWADRSCGVVALANSLIYMSRYKEEFQGIYDYPNLSKDNYMTFTNEVYNYIKPGIYGIPTLNKLNKGLQSFASTKTFKINSRKMSRPRNIDTTIKFIKRGLKNNSPVLMLTWNTKIKNLKYHWVTITGYYKTLDGKDYIITSNWAKMQTFSLDDWIKYRSCYKGLIYFY